MRVLHQSEYATVHLGDASEILPTIPAKSVDLLVTDPPYGVNWQSGRRRESFERMAGDSEGFDNLTVLELAIRTVRDKRHVYVFGFDYMALKEHFPFGGSAELIWDKALIGAGDLTCAWGPAHERIAFGAIRRSKRDRETGEGNLSARLRQGSVLRVKRKNGTAVKRHPTEKPVELMRRLIESSSNLGELVLDPFAGVGSTLVAAVLAGRRAIGIEIDEGYAATAVERLVKAERIAKEIEAA